MGTASALGNLGVTLQVMLLDLLLSGDNALLIAMACRSLPPRQRRQAMVFGTGIAIALRLLLTLLANALLGLPLLRLIGAIALVVIAIRLVLDDPRGGHGSAVAAPVDLSSAIAMVIIADLVMSTDNVVALAAVAQGSVAVLALGLLLSVPLLMFGSWQLTALLLRYPLLTRLGAAMLGWVAGDIGVSDALYADWIDRQAPALALVVPALTALFVLMHSRIIERSRPTAALLRPPARVAGPPSRRWLSEPAPAAAMPVPARITADAVMPRDAGASAEPGAGAPNRRPRRAPVAGLAWAAAAGVLAIGAGYGLLGAHLLPVPAGPIRYNCASQGVDIYYRSGTNRIRIASGANAISGIVSPDNRVDWGDYRQATRTLGFAPPTRIVSAVSRTLRVDGGLFEDVPCSAR